MICCLLKDHIKLTNQSVRLRIRILFLRKCISLGLIPPQFDMSKRYDNVCLYYNNSKKHLRLLYMDHVKTVLRLELGNTYRHLRNMSNKIYKNYNQIMNVLLSFITGRFFCLSREE